jgi:hypothetical protein
VRSLEVSTHNSGTKPFPFRLFRPFDAPVSEGLRVTRLTHAKRRSLAGGYAWNAHRTTCSRPVGTLACQTTDIKPRCCEACRSPHVRIRRELRRQRHRAHPGGNGFQMKQWIAFERLKGLAGMKWALRFRLIALAIGG